MHDVGWLQKGGHWFAEHVLPVGGTNLPPELEFPEDTEQNQFYRNAIFRAARLDLPANAIGVLGSDEAQKIAGEWWPPEIERLWLLSLAFVRLDQAIDGEFGIETHEIGRVVELLAQYHRRRGRQPDVQELVRQVEEYIAEYRRIKREFPET